MPRHVTTTSRKSIAKNSKYLSTQSQFLVDKYFCVQHGSFPFERKKKSIYSTPTDTFDLSSLSSFKAAGIISDCLMSPGSQNKHIFFLNSVVTLTVQIDYLHRRFFYAKFIIIFIDYLFQKELFHHTSYQAIWALPRRVSLLCYSIIN